MDYMKKMVKSKMFWLGVSQIFASVALLVSGEVQIQDFLFGATGVLTIIFRIFTTMPIEDK